MKKKKVKKTFTKNKRTLSPKKGRLTRKRTSKKVVKATPVESSEAQATTPESNVHQVAQNPNQPPPPSSQQPQPTGLSGLDQEQAGLPQANQEQMANASAPSTDNIQPQPQSSSLSSPTLDGSISTEQETAAAVQTPSEPHPIPPANPTVTPETQPTLPTDAEEVSPLDNEGHKKRYIILGLVLILLLFAGGGGFYLFKMRTGSPTVNYSPKTPEKPSIATPTKKPLRRSDWYLDVLNGSGVTGLAAKTAQTLEKKGYHVIKTASANRSNYRYTELYVSKKNLKDAELLLEDLKKDLNIASVSGELEGTNSTASAQIILGKE